MEKELYERNGSFIPNEEAHHHLLKILHKEIIQLNSQISALKKDLSNFNYSKNGFLGVKAAAAYCGISRGTFDRYRYKTSIKIKGYQIDGKILYRREDLDSFIKLYAARTMNAGLPESRKHTGAKA